MAFHLIYGEHPVRLIDACLERICEEAVMWPTRRGYIIVPEKMKAEVERRYIEILQEKKGGKASDSAFMMIDVVSFSRFAYRVLSEVGGMGGKQMSPAAKTILLHRVLAEHKSEMPVLGNFAERVGFVSELDEVLGDFYRYGVSGTMLKEMDLGSEDPLTRNKIRDFGELMERMDALRAEMGFAPERDSMRRLSEVLTLFSEDADETKKWPLSRLSFLREASCWIMGFGENRNFTPEEWNIVTKLAIVMSQVTMTCVAGSDDGEDSGEDICHFGEQTIRNILKTFPLASAVKVEPSEKRDPALCRLSSDFAARSCEKRPDLSMPCEIKVFHQISDELEYVAARIKEAVQFQGLRYRDITVVLCDPSQYSTNLHAAFSRYGLDAFIDSRRPMMGTIWMQYLTALLDMSIYNWDLSSVITYLKSGFVPVEYEMVDRFENYCLAHGVKNKKKMLDCERFALTYAEKKSVQAVLPHLKKAAEDLSLIEKAKTCCERAIALHNMIGDKRKNIEYYVDEWQKAGNSEAALALAVSYNYADDALRALAEEIGDFPISISNFRDALLSALENKELAAIPSYVDQITIAKPSDAYRRPCRMMFIVGAERKNFPYSAPSEGYLRNRERQVISEKLSIDFPNHAKDQSYADFFTAYALLDAPSERLIFTVQNSVEPSSVVLFLKEMYPSVQSEILGGLSLSDPRVLIRDRMEDYLRAVISGRQQVSPEEYDKAIAVWQNCFSADELSFEEPINTELLIPKDLMDARYGEKLLMSVSAVESYVYCPYHYFCEKVLRLQEREIQQVQATEMGSLGHEVLERALKEFREKYLAAADEQAKENVLLLYQNKDKMAWSRELLHLTQEATHYGYCDDAALKMAADTKLLAATSETLSMIFSTLDPKVSMPTHFERSFGDAEVPGYELKLSDGRVVTFHGTIDRVDINEEGKSFQILDYKTGPKTIDYDKLFAGASVQLPAYMHVYHDQHPQLDPERVSYIRVTRVKTRKDELALRLDPETIKNAREKAVKDTFCASNMQAGRDVEEMKQMGEFAMERIRENCEKLYAGHFDAKPGKVNKHPLMKCMDCEFNQVCNGDSAAPDYNYLPQMKKVLKEDGKAVSKKADQFFGNLRGEAEES